ncbi:MAG: hypothetical protein R3B91_03235 [Planctomycetaceae bacterium]
MLRILGKDAGLCDGVTRREWLRVGSIGLGGLSLPTLLAQRAADASAGAHAPPVKASRSSSSG